MSQPLDTWAAAERSAARRASLAAHRAEERKGERMARTALGFAGVRGLPIDDADAKAGAEAKALAMAVRCIKGRGAGVAALSRPLYDGERSGGVADA